MHVERRRKEGLAGREKSPILVIDLNGNKRYTCVVVARNLAGHSPPSAPSNPATVLTPLIRSPSEHAPS